MINIMVDKAPLEGYSGLSLEVNGTTVDYGLVSDSDLREIVLGVYEQSKKLLVDMSGEKIEEDLTWKLI